MNNGESFLKILLSKIHAVILFLCGVMLILISVLLFLSVLFRYLLLNPIVWSEEITGFLLVWMVLLSAPVGHALNEHVAIDALSRIVREAYKPYLSLARAIILLFVSGIIVAYGIPHTVKSMNQIFPTLEWIRYGYMYAALPVGYGLLGLACLENLLSTARQILKRNG